MATEVARLFVTIDSKGVPGVTRDLAGVDKGLKSTSRSADNAKKTFQGLGTVAKTAGLALGGALAFGAKKAIDEYRDAEKVGRQTNAVIKSTGGAANVSAKQVESLAQKLSLKSGKDDEAIQSGANLLLTFKGIRNEAGKNNDVFNQTVAVTNDMASAMGMDMKSAALQVGKALNDPAAGLGKLQRVGVTFTDQQKKQIQTLQDSGRTMEAQKIILAELNSEFAGSAAANADPFDKLKVAVDNLFETVGRAFVPALASAADVLATFVGQMETGQGTGGRFAAAIQGGWEALQPFIQLGKQAVDTFKGLDTNMKLVVAGFAAFGALAAVVLLPISAPLVAIAAAAAGVAAAAILIRKNWGTIGPIFQQVKQAVTDFANNLSSSIDISSDDLRSFAQAARNVGTVVGWVFENYLLPLIQRVLPAIQQILGGWVSFFSGWAKLVSGILTGDFGQAWEGVKQIFTGALNIILGTLRAITAPFRQLVVTIANVIKAPFVSAWNAITGVFRDGLNTGLSYMRSVVGVYRSVGSAIGSAVLSGFNVIKDIPGNAKKVFDSAFDFLNGLPSKFLEFGKRMASALVRPLSSVSSVITGLASGVAQAVRGVINSGLSIINRIIGYINALPSKKTPIGTIGFPDLPFIAYAASGMKTSGATLAVVGEGNGPEYVIPTEPRYRKRAMGLLGQAAGDLGIPGFAAGGAFGAGVMNNRDKANSILHRLWGAARGLYPGAAGYPPTKMGGGSPFVGAYANPNGARAGRGIVWPDWALKMFAAMDPAYMAMALHEWAHFFQRPSVFTGPDWQSEGGAEAFSRRYARQVFAAAGIPFSMWGRDFSGGAAGGSYDSFVSMVRKQKGVDWIARDQFVGAASGMKTNGATLALIGEGRGAEYVIPTEARYRSNALGLLASAASDLGIPGFKSGKGKTKATAEGKKRTTLSDAADAAYQGRESLASLTPSTADDIRVRQGRLKELWGYDEATIRKNIADPKVAAGKKPYRFAPGSLLSIFLSDRGKYKQGTVGYANFTRSFASAISESKGILDQLDQLRAPADNAPTLPDPGTSGAGLDAGGITDPNLTSGSVTDPGVGSGGSGGGSTGPSPDQQAILDQANKRASIAERANQLSSQFIQAAFGSGDIGSGNYGNAFGAAAGITINTLHPGDPRTLQAIAQAAAAGWGLSSFVGSSIAPTGV